MVELVVRPIGEERNAEQLVTGEHADIRNTNGNVS